MKDILLAGCIFPFPTLPEHSRSKLANNEAWLCGCNTANNLVIMNFALPPRGCKLYYIYIYIYYICIYIYIILKKNHLYGFKTFQSNGASPVLLIFYLDLYFKVKVFLNFLYMRTSRKQREVAQTLLLPSQVKHLPSNGATANVVHRDVEYIFKVVNFTMWISQ